MLKNIEATIEVLERLKGESPEFQQDALWKIGDYLAWAVEEQKTLNAEELFAELRDYHRQINEMEARERD